MAENVKKRYLIWSCYGIFVTSYVIFFCRYIFSRCEQERTAGYFAVVCGIVLGILGIQVYLLAFQKEYKYEKLLLICALGWGLVFTMILPPLMAPDEHVHFGTAYQVSNFILGDEQESESVIGIIGRQEDSLTQIAEIEEWRYPGIQQYENIANGNWIGDSYRDEKGELGVGHLYCYNRYVVPALGITVARILHMGLMGMIFMGRIFNILFFTLVSWIVIKIIPKGKVQVISLTMIPMLTELYASYSYDATSNTLAILFVGLCIYYSESQRKMHIWDIAVLLISYVLLSQIKGVYYPFILLLFTIPWKKWKDFLKECVETKARKIGWIGTAIAGIIFMIIKKPIEKSYFYAYLKIALRRNYLAEQIEIEGYSLHYALTHISETIHLWGNTLKTNTLGYFKQMLGYKLGMFDVHIWDGFVFIMAILLICGICIGGHREKWNRKMTIAILTAVLCIIMVYVGAMLKYTPITNIVIGGIQGRYFLPILTMLLMMFGNNCEENIGSLRVVFAQSIVMALIVGNILLVTLYR